MKNRLKDGEGVIIYDNDSTAAYYRGPFLDDMRYLKFNGKLKINGFKTPSYSVNIAYCDQFGPYIK